MNEEICFIANKEKRQRMNGKMMSLFEFYKVCIKWSGQFFFLTYLLTCLNKDGSVLLSYKYLNKLIS